ncbi:uncharacterized protein FYW61_004142 isoform 2-T2 [Anableps anableps]
MDDLVEPALHQIKEEEEPELMQIKEEEEAEYLKIKKEEEEPELVQIKKEEEGPEPFYIKVEEEEPEGLHVKEEDEVEEPLQVKEEEEELCINQEGSDDEGSGSSRAEQGRNKHRALWDTFGKSRKKMAPPSGSAGGTPSTGREGGRAQSRSPRWRTTRRRSPGSDVGDRLLAMPQEQRPYVPEGAADEAYHFALSVVPLLARLERKRRQQAKVDIIKVLIGHEHDSATPQEGQDTDL